MVERHFRKALLIHTDGKMGKERKREDDWGWFLCLSLCLSVFSFFKKKLFDQIIFDEFQRIKLFKSNFCVSLMSIFSLNCQNYYIWFIQNFEHYFDKQENILIFSYFHIKNLIPHLQNFPQPWKYQIKAINIRIQ